MAPPAVAIILGVTVAVGLGIAFHQFVYEPHLSSKVDIMVQNWLEKRRQKRRQAAAYREVPEDDHGDKNSEVVAPVELDDMVKEEVAEWRSVRPLTINEVGGDSTLRRRNTSNRVSEGEDSVWTLRPTAFEPLVPTPVAPRGQTPATLAPTLSQTSTPSTVETSLLGPVSPTSPATGLSLAGIAQRTSSPGSTSSQRDPLADSILSDGVRETLFSAPASPPQSPVRISPRGLQVNLAPTSDVEGDDDTHPLSRARVFVASPQARSPLASTLYESLAGTPTLRSTPSVSGGAHSLPQALPPQLAVHSPLSDSLSLVDHPASTASWSDIGSTGAEGERDELFLGSDAESWARARGVRHT